MSDHSVFDAQDFGKNSAETPAIAAAPADAGDSVAFQITTPALVPPAEIFVATDSAVPLGDPKRTTELHASTGATANNHAAYRLTWLMTLTAILLSSTWIVPYTVEQIEYARERGRQKAQVDVATVALKDLRLPLQEISKAYQLVSQRVGPSVVHINVSEDEGDTKSDGREQLGFHQRKTDGQGSGVIIDTDGHILTNRHVVHSSRNIEAFLSDGRRVSAKIIGEDNLTDLAVLKINADRLVPAEWGDSQTTEVGALVWAVGSPFGLERSITFGIVSAKHRSGHAGTLFQDLMQTDAAVNPGNSGGPLVDITGRVVGINTAIVGPSYQGISFAIPSHVARDVFQRLKREGRVTRGWLGVELERVPSEEVKRLGLKSSDGAYVKRLADERLGIQSPARTAGILAADIIIRWNDQPVDSPATLIALIGKTEIGKQSEVKLLREGEEQTLSVAVGSRPDQLN